MVAVVVVADRAEWDGAEAAVAVELEFDADVVFEAWMAD